MKSTRKIIVYIAASVDGYIARPDGDVEWLNRRQRRDYGMRALGAIDLAAPKCPSRIDRLAPALTGSTRTPTVLRMRRPRAVS